MRYLIIVLTVIIIGLLTYLSYNPATTVSVTQSEVMVINPHVIPYCDSKRCTKAIEFIGISNEDTTQTIYVDDLDGYSPEEALKYIYREGHKVCINHHNTLVISICS